MTTQAPQSLLVFRPQACTDTALLERMLFERGELADLLVDRVRDSALTGALHQQLIHGPRGSGKTHVLTVVFNRLVADEELAGKLLIARLAEEQWDIASFSDLCARILEALAKRYPESPAAGWEERLRAIPLPARSRDMGVAGLERAALGLIEETVGPNLLLVIAENLGDLFSALEGEGQQKLRAHVQQSRNWVLLASAQSLFPAITSRNEPFFRFFQTHELDALDPEGTYGFLQRLAGDPAIGDPELHRVLATPQGQQRIRSIDKLCGGNHRLLTMLYPFLAGDGLVDLVEPFLRMVDRELTPYYQERLRWLSSPQQRKIATHLAREGRPRAMKEVAQACFITEQSASKQLRGLEEVGFVLLTREGRQTFCEIREPLLRLVLDLQDHRDGAARTIVRVLRAWYAPPQLADLETSEAVRSSRLYHESVRMALMETRAEMHTQAAAALEGLGEIGPLLERGHFNEALSLIQTKGHAGPQGPSLMALEASVLAGLGRWPEAERRFEEAQRAALACEEQIERACALHHCGLAASRLAWHERAADLGRQALDAFRQLAKADPERFEPDLARSLSNLGVMLSDLGRHEEALAPAQEAVATYRRLAEQRPEAFEPGLAMSLSNLGRALSELGRHEDALAPTQEAADIRRRLAEQRPEAFEPDLAGSLNNLGIVLSDLGRHEEAVARRLEAVRSLVPPYRRSKERFGERLRTYARGWLFALRQHKSPTDAWQAMTELAHSLPGDDLLALDLLLMTAIWAREWGSVRDRLHPVTTRGQDVPPVAWDAASTAFIEAAVDPDASADELRSVYAASPGSFRSAVADRLIGYVPRLLRESLDQLDVAERAAQRIETVFSGDELAGKALELLLAGIAYLKSGKQTKALLHLPVEQRQLIQEACQ